MGIRGVLEGVEAARAHAQRALELSPADARAHAVLCSVAGLYDYDWKEAGRHFRLALAAKPVPGDVRVRCSLNYLLPLGRVREAIEQCSRALEQDRLNVFGRGMFAMVLNFGEDYDRALVEAQKTIELDESHWLPHVPRPALNACVFGVTPDIVTTRNHNNRNCTSK